LKPRALIEYRGSRSDLRQHFEPVDPKEKQ